MEMAGRVKDTDLFAPTSSAQGEGRLLGQELRSGLETHDFSSALSQSCEVDAGTHIPTLCGGN